VDERDPMDEDNDSDPGRGWDDPEDSDDEEDEGVEASASTAKTKPTPTPKPQSKPKAPRADDDEENDNDDSTTDSGDDADADAEYAEYEKYFEKYMTLPAHEKAMLTEDARELARAQDAENEEDEEIKKLTEAMEAELFGHGALNLNPPKDESEKRALKSTEKADKGKGKAKAKPKVSFAAPTDDDVEEIAREDGSGSEDEELLDEDYNLVQNMLAAFKGQAGAAGPAGNMLKAMGIQFPQDADDEVQGSSKGKNNVGEGRANENPMRKQDWYME